MFKRVPKKITGQHRLQIGHEEIDITYTLTRRRSMSIIVRPNLSVEVKAPLRASVPRLIKELESKAGWIQKHREKFKGKAGVAPPKQYIDGEVFSYLGNKYILQIINSKTSFVTVNGTKLEVHCRAKSPRAIRAQLGFWYNERALEVFAERLSICLQYTALLKLPKHRVLNVKKMKRRWGSCAANRTITLNPELVAAPLECIDYVITHELCHLREHNHSPRYYKLLTTAMPGWKAYKELLNKTTETNFI